MPGTAASATRVVAGGVAGAVEEAQADAGLDRVGELEAEHVGVERPTAASRSGTISTTWPSPCSPVTKPDIGRPGVNAGSGRETERELVAEAERIGEPARVR